MRQKYIAYAIPACWWLGDRENQAFNSHDIDLVNIYIYIYITKVCSSVFQSLRFSAEQTIKHLSFLLQLMDTNENLAINKRWNSNSMSMIHPRYAAAGVRDLSVKFLSLWRNCAWIVNARVRHNIHTYYSNTYICIYIYIYMPIIHILNTKGKWGESPYHDLITTEIVLSSFYSYTSHKSSLYGHINPSCDRFVRLAHTKMGSLLSPGLHTYSETCL